MNCYLKTTNLKERYRGMYTYFKRNYNKRIISPSLGIGTYFNKYKNDFDGVSIMISRDKINIQKYNA
jgi:hypothetical protein